MRIYLFISVLFGQTFLSLSVLATCEDTFLGPSYKKVMQTIEGSYEKGVSEGILLGTELEFSGLQKKAAFKTVQRTLSGRLEGGDITLNAKKLISVKQVHTYPFSREWGNLKFTTILKGEQKQIELTFVDAGASYYLNPNKVIALKDFAANQVNVPEGATTVLISEENFVKILNYHKINYQERVLSHETRNYNNASIKVITDSSNVFIEGPGLPGGAFAGKEGVTRLTFTHAEAENFFAKLNEGIELFNPGSQLKKTKLGDIHIKNDKAGESLLPVQELITEPITPNQKNLKRLEATRQALAKAGARGTSDGHGVGMHLSVSEEDPAVIAVFMSAWSRDRQWIHEFFSPSPHRTVAHQATAFGDFSETFKQQLASTNPLDWTRENLLKSMLDTHINGQQFGPHSSRSIYDTGFQKHLDVNPVDSLSVDPKKRIEVRIFNADLSREFNENALITPAKFVVARLQQAREFVKKLRSQKLHTDLLAEQFGPIQVKVQDSNDQVRHVILAEKASGKPLTFATSYFADNILFELAGLHAKIKAGASMGATFREAGYLIHKIPVSEGKIIATPEIAEQLSVAVGTVLHYKKYQFSVERAGSDLIPYSTVEEIYHPDVKIENNAP